MSNKWYSVCLVQGVGRAKKSQDHTKTGATISLQQKQHLQERQEKTRKGTCRYKPVAGCFVFFGCTTP